VKDIGVGIIGTGFMGKAHGLAYRAAAGVFPLKLNPVLEMVADNNAETGKRAFRQLGFRRLTQDWTELVRDPAIAIVSITAPNIFHKEMALAAIAHGKHVHCEKPLAPNADDAREMTEAAEKAQIVTQVGFNYVKNPLMELAKEMVASGELGEITGFRGIHAEDYMSDPGAPFSWRVDPSGGGGAVADLGSHIIGLARFLLGPISAVQADLNTVVPERPIAAGAAEKRKVLVDDVARMLVRFERGCGGTIEASWVASGRKMQLAFELYGTKGALAFSQERFNELMYYKQGSPGRDGFVRIEAGPQHHPYGLFCVAPGHQLGFNDLKTIEAAHFLEAIAGGAHKGPDFREAFEVQRVVDSAIRSAKERSWMDIGAA
jgi:predicted dehydrogenase